MDSIFTSPSRARAVVGQHTQSIGAEDPISWDQSVIDSGENDFAPSSPYLNSIEGLENEVRD